MEMHQLAVDTLQISLCSISAANTFSLSMSHGSRDCVSKVFAMAREMSQRVAQTSSPTRRLLHYPCTWPNELIRTGTHVCCNHEWTVNAVCLYVLKKLADSLSSVQKWTFADDFMCVIPRL